MYTNAYGTLHMGNASELICIKLFFLVFLCAALSNMRMNCQSMCDWFRMHDKLYKIYLSSSICLASPANVVNICK